MMEQIDEKNSWFETWFESPYYHILYQNRDDKDATFLVQNLVQFLQPDNKAKVLDIACGSGRHAWVLSLFFHEVVGIDLSNRMINKAHELAIHKNLSFYQHDMRKVFRVNYFDYAFNFFTSFGYFSTWQDHVRAVNSFATALKPGGKLIIDYLNIHATRKNLIKEEIKTINDIHFHITRKEIDQHLIKTIQIEDPTRGHFQFEEKVASFDLEDFKKLMASNSLELQHTFGDYDLSSFDSALSPRLIMIFEKALM